MASRNSSSWPGLVLVIGTLLSMGLFAYARFLSTSRARIRFEEAATRAQRLLEDRLRDGEDLLRGVRGFANAHGPLDRASYRAYMEALDLKTRLPGLLGVTYGVPVPPDQREALLQWLAREYPHLPPRIHPGWGDGTACIAVLGEPEADNTQAIGFNSLSLPEQRLSLERARDSGQLEASAPMAIAQAPGAGPGVVLRLAVYRAHEPIGTVAERRKAFVGYANAVFLMRQLSAEASNRAAQDGIAFELADRTESPAAVPFLVGGAPAQASSWRWLGLSLADVHRGFQIGNRRWELRSSAGSTFFQISEIALPWIVGLGGILVTLLLAALVQSISLMEKRALRLAGRMTEELKRSESRLRAIARIVPDLMLVLDSEGRYLEVLTQDESQLAAERNQLLNRKVDEILSPDLARRVTAIIQKALAEHQIQSLEYSLEAMKGTLRFEARIAPMDVEIDGHPCVLWVARDVTEQRAHEELLRQTQKLESLGVLAGGIAHDFNNLLTAIRGRLGLGIQALEDGESPLHHLERMDASIQRAADLAQQLLAYSGHGAFRVESVDLNALVSEMSELLGISKSKKVHLNVRLQDALPTIHGDRVQLQQVVMNLLTNASEAIGDHPGLVELRTGETWLDTNAIEQRMPGQGLPAGRFVTLCVQDDGCGMTQEVLSRIFDPFFSTKPSGRGLGLSAMRGILQSHHAGLEIHSKQEEGTTLQLFFPASDLALPPPTAAKPLPATVDYGGLILLAEDEPCIRETSRMMAERLGFQVIEAKDGEEAWNLFQSHRDELRLVILDLTMPRRGGAEVYQLIRQQSEQMPVLLCSGYSRDALPGKRDAMEPREFLQKPFSSQEFEAAIRDLLGHS
ncbi:MAG TPA: CHASE domain-containing protein [Holophaga sp.]|nr:CHASE domain-containing protein [Holophaga sp.]